MAAKKRDDRYECLADSLAEETLTEAADTLFGQRRRIEQALQDYQDKVDRLLKIHKTVEASLAFLHFLLRRGEPETVAEFYNRLDIDPERMPRPEPDVPAGPGKLQIPFGLSSRGRYEKLVCRAYAVMITDAEIYMQGRYYVDPEDARCTRITVNYSQVKGLCDKLIELIDRANKSDSFMQALQFSKRLDVERSEKEKLVGAPLQYTIDREMAFKPPDFNRAGLPAYPDFPPLDKVKKTIKTYSSEVFAEASEEIRSLLQEIRKAH